MTVSIESHIKIRDEIMSKIKEHFYKLSYIHACWLGWSDANNEVDQYSDIDLFLCIDDGEEKKTFTEAHKCLSKIWKLDYVSDISSEWNQKWTYYHIEWTPESLLIEIWLIDKTQGMVFEEWHPCLKPKILFDKMNIITFQPLDPEVLAEKIQIHLIQQKELFAQHARVTTYINRDNYIEATNYYIKYVYLPLIWLLRVLHTPYLYNWWRIHISRHFPKETVHILENLMEFHSIKDIKENLEIAKKLFHQIEKDIKKD